MQNMNSIPWKVNTEQLHLHFTLASLLPRRYGYLERVSGNAKYSSLKSGQPGAGEPDSIIQLIPCIRVLRDLWLTGIGGLLPSVQFSYGSCNPNGTHQMRARGHELSDWGSLVYLLQNKSKCQLQMNRTPWLAGGYGYASSRQPTDPVSHQTQSSVLWEFILRYVAETGL